MADKLNDAPVKSNVAEELVQETPAPAAQTAAEAIEAVDATRAPVSVDQLSTEGEIAARTAPDAEVGTKFRKTFVISKKGFDLGAPQDDMHRANCVATLQEALNRGLHPKGEASYVGDDQLTDGSEALHYEVEVVLASEDEDPASTYTPSFAIDDMGGSTVQADN